MFLYSCVGSTIVLLGLILVLLKALFWLVKGRSAPTVAPCGALLVGDS